MNIFQLAPILAVGAIGLVVVPSVVREVSGDPSVANNPVELRYRFSQLIAYDEDVDGFVVEKWDGPVNIFIRAEGRYRRFGLMVADLSDSFSFLTGLPVQIVEDRDDANVTMVISTPEVLERAMDQLGRSSDGGRVCTAFTSTDETHQIVTGLILIPDWSGSRFLKGCIEHELLHLMGLRGHLELQDTVLRRYWRGERITETDKRLLSLLYHPCIEAGMTREVATTAVSAILAGECSD